MAARTKFTGKIKDIDLGRDDSPSAVLEIKLNSYFRENSKLKWNYQNEVSARIQKSKLKSEGLKVGQEYDFFAKVDSVFFVDSGQIKPEISIYRVEETGHSINITINGVFLNFDDERESDQRKYMLIRHGKQRSLEEEREIQFVNVSTVVISKKQLETLDDEVEPGRIYEIQGTVRPILNLETGYSSMEIVSNRITDLTEFYSDIVVNG